jgi:hypothetical protein
MLPCTGPYFAAEVTLGCERNELTRYELCIYSRVTRHSMAPRFKTIEQNQCIFHPCSDLRDQGNTRKRRVAIIARCKYTTPCYAFLVVHSDPSPPGHRQRGARRVMGSLQEKKLQQNIRDSIVQERARAPSCLSKRREPPSDSVRQNAKAKKKINQNVRERDERGVQSSSDSSTLNMSSKIFRPSSSLSYPCRRLVTMPSSSEYPSSDPLSDSKPLSSPEKLTCSRAPASASDPELPMLSSSPSVTGSQLCSPSSLLALSSSSGSVSPPWS